MQKMDSVEVTVTTVDADARSEKRIVQTEAGPFMVWRRKYLGRHNFTAWEPFLSLLDAGHGVICFECGNKWGEVSSRSIPAEVDALPVGEARFAACRWFWDINVEKARSLVCTAFPEYAQPAYDGCGTFTISA